MKEMDNPENNIPVNAEKILFAEDLMNRIARFVSRRDYGELNTVEEYRRFIYNAFNSTVMKAVIFLFSQTFVFDLKRIGFLFRRKMFTRNVFMSLARNLERKYFSKGFEARKFLYYCVHLGNLGLVSLRAGFDGFLLGAICIFRVIRELNMSLGGWDILNSTASRYADMCQEHGVKLCFSIEDSKLKEDHMLTKSPNDASPEISSSSDSSSDGEVAQDPFMNERKYFRQLAIAHLDLDEYYIVTQEWKDEMIRLIDIVERCEPSDGVNRFASLEFDNPV